MTKSCKECGVSFETKGAEKFCKACGTPDSLNCETCGVLFKPKNKATRNCSYECGQAAVRKHAEAHYQKWFKCERCGIDFKNQRSTNCANRYCSRECSFAVMRITREQRALERASKPCAVVCKTCQECQKPFCVPTKKISPFCSNSCYMRHRAQKQSRRDLGSRACAECGNVFDVQYGNKRNTFCSSKCSKIEARRTRKAVERGARKVGGPVRFARIYDRDNGKCHICGLVALRRVEAFHPLKATLDHVWPLTLGGDHSPDNVRVAHFYCNSAKGPLMSMEPEWKQRIKQEIVQAMEGTPVDWKLIGLVRKELNAGATA